MQHFATEAEMIFIRATAVYKMGNGGYFVICPRCDFVYASFHAYDCELDPITKI